MSEQTVEVDAGPVVKVARDLSAIIELAGSLEDQAINKANDKLMPGGLAMVALAAVANLGEWEEKLEAAEHRHLSRPEIYPAPIVEDDDDWEPPLQTLGYWSEQWRRTHRMEFQPEPHRPYPTIATEANFLRWALNWAWDNEPRWDKFATSIKDARSSLESLLYAGDREERTRVICDRDSCEKHPRLIKIHKDDPADDHYKCPSCKTRFDADAFKRAHSKQLRSEGAEKHVSLADAIGTLKALGRPERTIRKWLEPPLQHVADVCDECGLAWDPDEYPACPAETEDGDECGGILEAAWSGDANAVVQGYCELHTHKTLVWWPDMWRLHMTTKTRRRAVA